MCYFHPAMIKVTLRLSFGCTKKIQRHFKRIFNEVNTFRNMTILQIGPLNSYCLYSTLVLQLVYELLAALLRIPRVSYSNI